MLAIIGGDPRRLRPFAELYHAALTKPRARWACLHGTRRPCYGLIAGLTYPAGPRRSTWCSKWPGRRTSRNPRNRPAARRFETWCATSRRLEASKTIELGLCAHLSWDILRN